MQIADDYKMLLLLVPSTYWLIVYVKECMYTNMFYLHATDYQIIVAFTI